MEDEKTENIYPGDTNNVLHADIYPQVPEHKPPNPVVELATGVDKDPTIPTLTANGLLLRILFLFTVAMGTGLLAGRYVKADNSTLGLAIGSTIMVPLAIGFQLLFFAIARKAFTFWLLYPFLAVAGIGLSLTVTHMLQLFVSEQIAIGLQIFVVYMVVFTISIVLAWGTKKRKLTKPTITLLILSWLLIIGTYLLITAYTKQALRIALPSTKGFENSTACINICSNRTDPNKQSYTTKYQSTGKNFSASVALKRLRYGDTRNATGECQVISYIPNSNKRYEFHQTYTGTNVYKATTTNIGYSSSPTGTLFGPGEKPEPNTYEMTWQYYCFVQGLHRYEIKANTDFDIDTFMQGLMLTELPSNYRLYFGL